MDKIIKKRLVLGGIISALVAGPFFVRRLIRPVQMEESMLISVPSKVSPSGHVGLGRVCFEPITLPGTDVCANSVSASISPDRKVVLVTFSTGDWKAKLAVMNIDGRGSYGDVEVVYDFPGKTIVSSLGCSDEKTNGRVDFVFYKRFVFPPQSQEERGQGAEALCHLFLEKRRTEWTLDRSKQSTTSLASKMVQVREDLFHLGIHTSPISWLQGTNQCLYSNIRSILRYDFGSSDNRDVGLGLYDEIYNLSEMNASDNPGSMMPNIVGDVLCSNFRDNGDKTFSFLALFHEVWVNL